jgi:Stress responsive A/B Barrel Domain
MLQHYVFLRYRDGTSSAHIASFCERMRALRDAIAEIRHLEIGRDELHDARSWDVVLIMQFESVAALRAYQGHPAHRAVMAFNDPFVADLASVDFERSD